MYPVETLNYIALLIFPNIRQTETSEKGTWAFSWKGWGRKALLLIFLRKGIQKGVLILGFGLLIEQNESKKY